MTFHFLTLVMVGILMLARVSGPLWLRVLGRLLAGVLALGFSALAIGLYRLGDDRGWTGDGPGMLVVMLAIPVAAVCALAAWAAVLLPGGRRANGVPAWLALAVIAIGLGGSAYTHHDARLTGKPSHDAPIAALAFAGGGTELLTCDGAGTLKRWDVESRHLVSERAIPELAGIRELAATRDGGRAIAAFGDRAAIVALDAERPVVTPLAGVEDAALLPGDRAALAAGRTIRVVGLADSARALATYEVPAPVRSLAADAQGRIFAALEGGAVLSIEGAGAPREIARLANAPARLLVSPGGTWLVAIGADRRAAVIAALDGRIREVPGFGVHAVAFATEDILVFNSDERDGSALALSLERLATEPWIGQGGGIGALGVAPEVGIAAFAVGGDVSLLRAPGGGGHAYTSEWTRLVHRR